MTKYLLPTVIVFAAVLVAHANAANIVYPIDVTITSANPTGNPLQSDTVTGNITTDGTIGLLGPADILSWDLNLIDNLNASNNYELTPGDSTIVEDTGSGLSGTATALSFDFSGTAEFAIQANDPGPFSGYRYFCFSTGGACLPGESIVPADVFSDGAVLTGDAAPAGTLPLNPPSAVPEPSSGSIVAAALAFSASLAAMRRRFVRA